MLRPRFSLLGKCVVETQDDRFENASERAQATTGSDEMTSEQLAEAKRYGRLSLACDLADKVLDVVFLSAMGLVFAVPLDAVLAGSLRF